MVDGPGYLGLYGDRRTVLDLSIQNLSVDRPAFHHPSVWLPSVRYPTVCIGSVSSPAVKCGDLVWLRPAPVENSLRTFNNHCVVLLQYNLSGKEESVSMDLQMSGVRRAR